MLLVLLLSLTFISQAMASAIAPYHVMSSGCMEMQEQDMSMMDHSNHMMMADSVSTTDTSTNNCCVDMCNCYASGCSSVTVFITETEQSAVVDEHTLKIFSHSNLTLKQQSNSLYRPPIIS